MYAIINNGNIEKLGQRPNWRTDNGPLTESEWLEQGYYPLQDVPTFDPDTHKAVPIPQNQWVINQTDVGPTYEILPLTSQEITDRETQEKEYKINGIIKERTRRLALGFHHDFGDARGVHLFGTTKQDMDNWSEVSDGASAAINLGMSNTVFNIITETGPTQVTAMEWQAVLLTAAQSRQIIFSNSFALQNMNPIPDNYTDDVYWP